MTERPRKYELTCDYCGKKMTASRRDRRFCSQSCTAKARWERTTGAQLAEARRDKACEYCGSLFTSKRSNARFCSDLCRQRDQRRRNPGVATAQSRAWAQANPEKRRENRARFAERHPDHGKQRYVRLKADAERYAAHQEREHQYYLAHKEEFLERSKRRRVEGKSYSWRHGCDWNTLIEQLWQTQDGKCYLCGDPLDRIRYRAIHLDHDHSCCCPGYSCEICRRGLACPHCNVLIGWAKDDPDRLRRIAGNLEVANALVHERMEEASLIEQGILFDI